VSRIGDHQRRDAVEIRRSGFVRRDIGGHDVYFHRSVVEGAAEADLVSRRRVLVEIAYDERGRLRVSRLELADCFWYDSGQILRAGV
jgi:cold shock CspA family protein